MTVPIGKVENLAARARALFGNYASLHINGLGHIEVPVEQYATGEDGQLFVVFRHPKTHALQIDGLHVPGAAPAITSESQHDAVVDHGDGSFTVGGAPNASASK